MWKKNGLLLVGFIVALSAAVWRRPNIRGASW